MSQFVLNLEGPRWNRHEPHSMMLKGHAFIDGVGATAEEFSAGLNENGDGEDLYEWLQSCSGFYCWAAASDTRLLAGVDTVRSWPIFYGMNRDRLYLSDNAEWVRQALGEVDLDPIARDEFLLAGYVTGADTLYRRVKQLQAGEYLDARVTAAGLEVNVRRYWRFVHLEQETYDVDALRQELGRVTRHAIERLIEYAGGRQIAIPLSGGYDSRLVASLLREKNYSNVLCFSYGVLDNREAVVSRQVAHSLGFDWKFVEYTPDLWRKNYSTDEAREYQQKASNHCSLPHVQDWLALKQLMSRGELESDAVMVPGHSGDFVAGSHIPRFVFRSEAHSEEEVLQSLLDIHLSNTPRRLARLATDQILFRRLRSRIGLPFDGSSEQAANGIELWDWQERQAKYIVNSVRVYDAFKLDWWLPLWDVEFVRFWENVPLTLRRERRWFAEWITDTYQSVADPRHPAASLSRNASEGRLAERQLRRLVRRLPKPLTEPLLQQRRKFQIRHNFLAFEGLVNASDLSRYLRDGYNLIGMLSDSHLRKHYAEGGLG